LPAVADLRLVRMQTKAVLRHPGADRRQGFALRAATTAALGASEAAASRLAQSTTKSSA
jgi:hypothetical protein